MKLRIREAIKARGLTIQTVADAIGKSKQSLHGIIEKGNPTINTLRDIAEAIGAPISDLYCETSDELTALVYHKGEHYRASSVEELQSIVDKLRGLR